ncbi:MAG: phenylalanine--tRNA ligase subunit beta [Ardenticatenales bacterium]|nr:phenylalanine--tRNA ligase subunit beta [Ardenticatenales bacterium]
MQIPVSWLKDYVDIKLPVEDLAEKLTIAGLEVEKVEYIGVAGGNDKERLVWDREMLLLGQILKVEQHPDADRLVLATVEYGGDEVEVCVTGAPNLFPYLDKGDLTDLKLLTPFALEGAVVYDGHKEGLNKMTLKGRKLRGIYNRCMVCSEKELGISDEHEGIILFTGDDKPGTPLQDVLGDVVLHIDIIPNIARCASIVGVAREVAALTGQPLRLPSYDVQMDGAPIGAEVVLKTENPELNPRFTAIVIEGVKQKPSPYWMQRRLRLAGQRPINVVVDISNYVMLEMGQPNHTYDYDFLRRRANEYAGADRPVELITRLAHEGETLTTLDGKVHQLPPYTILVTDPLGNLGIGGIMGGFDSEIQDDTTNVLLEAAAWNYINVRRSGHALKINSEAGFRFSRGVHPSQSLLGAKRAAELMRTLAGGTIRQGILDYYPLPTPEPVIDLTAAEVKRLSGLELSLAEIGALLERLEFTVVDKGTHLEVTAPDHRIDIEGSHDLVEEVCRMYGYDRLPATIMQDVLPPQRSNVSLDKEERIRDTLVDLGLQEIITYRLTTPEDEAKLLVSTPALPDDRPYVTLANPITVERVALRHSLLASALGVAAQNSRFQERLALFEIGQIYLANEDGELPDELRRLSLVLTGDREVPSWAGAETPAGYDFFDLKGIIEDMLSVLHVQGLGIEPAQHPTFRPGRTARLTLFEKQLGVIGELHPLVVEAFDIRGENPVIAAELDLEVLLPKIKDAFKVDPISPYPPVREDLALIVDRAMPASTVEEVLRKAGGFLLKDLALFDVYTGPGIPADKKSLAYHLTFQAPNKTLTDKEMLRQRTRIISQAEEQLGAKLRG